MVKALTHRNTFGAGQPSSLVASLFVFTINIEESGN